MKTTGAGASRAHWNQRAGPETLVLRPWAHKTLVLRPWAQKNLGPQEPWPETLGPKDHNMHATAALAAATAPWRPHAPDHAHTHTRTTPLPSVERRHRAVTRPRAWITSRHASPEIGLCSIHAHAAAHAAHSPHVPA
eukprot:CAMPEP_0181325148 /NCGR_PEP_ID=MMETSP1101-20121128/20764_1 /TAXON_ID=46948 /ORGANISM="Rhodomonas abbreviata, Strain Caron Lab Isolate" /LENGTH=136 /DNA_ID=CAMNT_0023433423 /DNA_START=54 /DNA_END=461 /DNA_ORIENTATION=-